jgi:HSP20 family protein
MHLTIEQMEEHVRDIYRALTGDELREDELGKSAKDELGESTKDELSVDEVARRFIDLESSVRQIPTIDERVPPFSFTPLLDVIDLEDHIVLELAVPGVDRKNVEVTCSGEFITISGVRGGERDSVSHQYLHAEIPRGPFHRVVLIPTAFVAEPTIEVEQGLIRVRLPKAEDKAEAKAEVEAEQPDFEQIQNETKPDEQQFDVQQSGE